MKLHTCFTLRPLLKTLRKRKHNLHEKDFSHLFRCVSGFPSIITALKLQCPLMVMGRMCATSYQMYGVESVERADGVVQLLRRQPTQQVADGANGVRDHVDVHRRLWTRGEQHQMSASIPLAVKQCRIYLTDLGVQQLLHLSVVAAEHLLQAQPAEGKRKRSECMFPYKQTTVDTPPTGLLL